jgi:hypothetical protein
VRQCKWQCRHCSYVQSTAVTQQEGAECELCHINLVGQAPMDAVTSPEILRNALAIRDNVRSVVHPASSVSSAPPPYGTNVSSAVLTPQQHMSRPLTSKPSLVASSSLAKLRSERPYPRPDMWPHNAKCHICADKRAQKYCSCCKWTWARVRPSDARNVFCCTTVRMTTASD